MNTLGPVEKAELRVMNHFAIQQEEVEQAASAYLRTLTEYASLDQELFLACYWSASPALRAEYVAWLDGEFQRTPFNFETPDRIMNTYILAKFGISGFVFALDLIGTPLDPRDLNPAAEPDGAIFRDLVEIFRYLKVPAQEEDNQLIGPDNGDPTPRDLHRAVEKWQRVWASDQLLTLLEDYVALNDGILREEHKWLLKLHLETQTLLLSQANGV